MPTVSAIKQLLSWLAQDGSRNTKELRAIFRNEVSEKYSSAEMSKILGEGIVGWYREAYHRLKKSTRVHYKRALIDGFNALSTLPDRDYPPVLLTSEDFAVTSRRSASDSLSLEELQEVFGDAFISDVVAYCPAIHQMRHFLTWLSKDSARSSSELMEILRGEQSNEISDIQKIGITATSIRNWKKASASKLKPNTLGKYSSLVGFSFEALGRFPDSPYPKYDRRLVPSGERHVGSSHTLGDLNWPEVEHLRGAEKERECLAIVRNAAVTQLQHLYDLFKFGQSALVDQASGSPDNHSWNAVSTMLNAAHDQLMQCGSLDYTLVNGGRNFSDPSVWLDAGAPEYFFVGRGIVKPVDIIFSCLGTTGVSTTITAYALACDTGINPQPCMDLAQHPYVFLDDKTAGIADQGIIDLFKGRAGHNVFSYLSRSSLGNRDELTAIWEAVCGEHDQGNDAVFAHYSTVEFLLQYEEMANATREYDVLNSACSKFFVYRTNAGLSNSTRFETRWVGGTPFVSRKGVNWRAIRKSFAQITKKDTGSTAATKAMMGQTSQTVLTSAYLNTADVIEELELSTAFFQNVLQALLVRGKLVAIIIKIPSNHIAWFDGLAKISGIESAVGIGGEQDASESPFIRFEPTDDRFRELYLLHLSAQFARLTMPLGRWRIQALPLMGAIRALRRTLVHHGLRHAYVAAIRQVYNDLKSEKIVLPALLEL
jgi:hypothetical protein